MTVLELKRSEVEYHKVMASRLDLECRIYEMNESIRKLQDSVDSAMAREKELLETLNQAKQS